MLSKRGTRVFKDAEKQLESILKVVEKCPEPLKVKCFEILLTAYAEAASREAGARSVTPVAHTPPPPPPPPGGATQIPQSLQQRFGIMAKRIGVPVQNLERLFDFSAEPFTFHAFQLPGDKGAKKSRNVVLLVAAKSYLATGVWSADWAEVKAECTNHSCYDQDNHAANLKKGEGDEWFKAVNAGKPIELKPAGVTKAEELLKSLVEQL